MSLALESGALTNSRALRVRDVVFYDLADRLSGVLVCFMLVFSPWAFGTTEPWSICTMRACGYGLGFLLGIKWTIRWSKNYQPARWEIGTLPKCLKPAPTPANPARGGAVPVAAGGCFNRSVLTRVLAGTTLSLLCYCALAAVNARAAFNPVSGALDYRPCIAWLPHSFDRTATWDAFGSYLALAASFWAIRDWLLGKSVAESLGGSTLFSGPDRRTHVAVPARLKTLLWVLAASGGLLALEGIVQRISHSPRLLFLIQPGVNPSAQFASYAYRANAAQYFNLLWPASLGLWWTTRRSESCSILKHMPLACVGLMALCPSVSGARGASLVDWVMLAASLGGLLVCVARDKEARHGVKARSSAWLVLYFATVAALGLMFGWRQLGPRMSQFSKDLQQREALYETARRVARDYPLFGTGPGTFERVFQLYRTLADAYWPAQLHNDWLETRVTFGWVGAALIALSFCAILACCLSPGGIRLGSCFVFLVALSLAGCLVQARWDFPLQVYSILFLFVVWCAVLAVGSQRSS